MTDNLESVLDLFKTPDDRALVREVFTNNAEFREVANGVLASRAEFFKSLTDPRRNYDAECGYPDTSQLDAKTYKNMYERESIATRVVEVYPKESWKIQPLVYEVEDEDTETPFELRWKEIARSLRGESWYKKETGNPVWEALKRADILSGIGAFGVILLGIGDGKELSEPAAGIDARGRMTRPAGEDPLASILGNLYGGIEEPTTSPNRDLAPLKPEGETNLTDLLFLRAFDEDSVKVVEWEKDKSNPRYCLPTMYEITFHNPEDTRYTNISSGSTTAKVHWTRIIHVADNCGSNDLFGAPRQRPVYNKILNLHKLYGGSAEMYWRGAFPGLSIETHPSLGPNPNVNQDALRDQLWKYQNGLQRMLSLLGMTAKSLAPQVVDPTPQIDVQITGICIQLACPKRVFMGSERGELASSQDDDTWDERIRERQINYLIPRIIVPLIDRLICLRVLPEPGEDGYCAEWPDQKTLGELEEAQVLVHRVDSMSKYVTGSVDQVCDPLNFYTKFMKMTKEEAQQILDDTKGYLEEQNPDAEQEIVAGRNPPEIPEEPDPLKLREGEAMVDRDGKTIAKIPGRPKVPARK